MALLKDPKMNGIFLLLVVLTSALSTEAMAVLPRMETSNVHSTALGGLVKRNATAAANDDQLQLNINPDIINPDCGGIYPANINVQYAPDPFYLSSACQSVLNFIGGNKGNKNVDIIFTCLGQSTNGSGSRDIKVIINTAGGTVLNGANSGLQEIVGSMEMMDETTKSFLSASIEVVVKVDASAGTQAYQNQVRPE
ncbi:hypothetical protein LTR10_017622 [Elasticomyces elasticus]|uniref:Ecp2 effector protein domain-containing protein n=1 Tax=Exophiala sideris TaxID=1016849 RepID=A0ABR0JP48_9EURO|nr:hypothetical protein LTR10_017622 [Elasticomyces elasticus]KAK5038267.1 hypothetical protein LTS07_001737 [Exophiala sideris]KAK5044251.1 hypothetical protein LTR13_000607 [Exophiala sideris]KAK5067751.1 hypothetical protein LTR69_001740 [Exophiala sideris]KAK5184009.1 hypothetical protein LTR44_003514 [Eurotiomycetes sp. CCFEE 6388]